MTEPVLHILYDPKRQEPCFLTTAKDAEKALVELFLDENETLLVVTLKERDLLNLTEVLRTLKKEVNNNV